MRARRNGVEADGGDDAGVGEGRGGSDDGVGYVVVDCLVKVKVSFSP